MNLKLVARAVNNRLTSAVKVKQNPILPRG